MAAAHRIFKVTWMWWKPTLIRRTAEDIEYTSQIHPGSQWGSWTLTSRWKWNCVGLWTNYGQFKASFLISLVQKAAIRWKKCISSPIYCENNKTSGVYLDRGSLFSWKTWFPMSVCPVCVSFFSAASLWIEVFYLVIIFLFKVIDDVKSTSQPLCSASCQTCRTSNGEQTRLQVCSTVSTASVRRDMLYVPFRELMVLGYGSGGLAGGQPNSTTQKGTPGALGVWPRQKESDSAVIKKRRHNALFSCFSPTCSFFLKAEPIAHNPPCPRLASPTIILTTTLHSTP